MRKLPQNHDDNLIVGFDTSDDAGVYQISEELAVVTTADYITPPLDDPYLFGQIAAANSISDIYAMGARPVSCLNLAAFPSNKLDNAILLGIIEGALDKITEAGAVLAGGHTTRADEPTFGLAVTGLVHPEQLWRNTGARPGDALILTKPLGSGVLFNANLKGWVSDAAMQACVDTLVALNKAAAEVLQRFTVHAATDVTGFGLNGHAFEMAQGSDVTFVISIDALPIMDEAIAMYEKGMNTGSNGPNKEIAGAGMRIERELIWPHEQIFYDPQTSGGLLVAVPEQEAAKAVAALHDAGVAQAVIIGEVRAYHDDVHLVYR